MCTMPIGNSRSVSIQNQAGPKKARKEGNLCPNFQKSLGHRNITRPNKYGASKQKLQVSTPYHQKCNENIL